jgi:hypothetical protein
LKWFFLVLSLIILFPLKRVSHKDRRITTVERSTIKCHGWPDGQFGCRCSLIWWGWSSRDSYPTRKSMSPPTCKACLVGNAHASPDQPINKSALQLKISLWRMRPKFLGSREKQKKPKIQQQIRGDPNNQPNGSNKNKPTGPANTSVHVISNNEWKSVLVNLFDKNMYRTE